MEEKIRKEIEEYIALFKVETIELDQSVVLEEYRQDHSAGFTEDVTYLSKVNFESAWDKIEEFYKDDAYRNAVLGFLHDDNFIEFSRIDSQNYIRINTPRNETWFDFKEGVKKVDFPLIKNLLRVFHLGQAIEAIDLVDRKDDAIILKAAARLAGIIGIAIFFVGIYTDPSFGVSMFGIAVTFLPEAFWWLIKKESYSFAFLSLARYSNGDYKLRDVYAQIAGNLTVAAFFITLILSLVLRLRLLTF